MLTRATVPLGLPKAPRIPVWSLSAPAHDNILLIRMTWYGWARTRRWKPSFPAILTRYLRELLSETILARCFCVPLHSPTNETEIEAYYGLSSRHLYHYAQSLPFQPHDAKLLTCWRRYGLLPALPNSAAHIRWRQGGCREEIRQRSHASVRVVSPLYRKYTHRWEDNGVRTRPRSKILILASGTPRLNLDLGYGYQNRNVSPLLYSFFPFRRSGIVAGLRLTLDEDVQRGLQSSVAPEEQDNIPCSCSSGSISLDDEPF